MFVLHCQPKTLVKMYKSLIFLAQTGIFAHEYMSREASGTTFLVSHMFSVCINKNSIENICSNAVSETSELDSNLYSLCARVYMVVFQSVCLLETNLIVSGH